jgi:hypothetical protein
MNTINHDDLNYVLTILKRKDLNLPTTITFWIDNSALIGTSVTFDDKRRFWIQAQPESVKECATRLELLESVFPLEGQYLAYMRQQLAGDSTWLLISSGNYSHQEVALYYDGKRFPRHCLERMLIFRGYKEVS